MPTISDVAKRAGVAPITVSRVLNGAENVNAATRRKVEQAIQELGYLPNLAARSLRSGQTRTLALLVPDIGNPFWPIVARGIEDAAQNGGYSIFLCNTDENPAKQLNYLRAVLQQRVDGVILAPCDPDAHSLQPLREQGTPTVIIDRRVDGWDVDSVAADSVSGARALVQHLLSLGHTRIAILTGPRGVSTAEDRVVGYRLALHDAGIEIDARLVRYGEYRIASGSQMAQAILDEGLAPTAIFTANQAIALGALDALTARGLDVPRDVALVSFDDLPDVDHLFPFLTVVAQSAYDMGLNAAQLLLSRMSADVALQPRHVILPTRLILRYSCGRTLRTSEAEGYRLLRPRDVAVQTVLVKPLTPAEREWAATLVPEAARSGLARRDAPTDTDRSSVRRLRRALQHQSTDRVPCLAYPIAHRALVESVLGRSAPAAVNGSASSIAPGDQVEFAQRLGLDAVGCDLTCRLEPGTARGDLVTPPRLADQLSRLESYLRAAQRTEVGVFATLGSRLSSDAASVAADGHEWLDVALAQQEKVLRAVCDRFAADLVFVMLDDTVLGPHPTHIQAPFFANEILPRLRRLIQPAREHGLQVGLRVRGPIDGDLAEVREAGFEILAPSEADLVTLAAIKRMWGDALTLVGGVPPDLLLTGSQETIEAQVREACLSLGAGGGFVLSPSDGIPEAASADNFMTLVRAMWRWGRESTDSGLEIGNWGLRP